MDVLSSALRGVITASPGHRLFVADFASIEARVLFWLADDEGGLQMFRDHIDSYNDMASKVYHRPIDRKGKDAQEGQLGKAAILGLGYQMGASKFVATAATYGVALIEDIECAVCGAFEKAHRRASHRFEPALDPDTTMTAQKVVDIYRGTYWRVVDMWNDQEAAAIAAVEYDDSVPCGKVRWFMDGGADNTKFLYCELPSGRCLAYPDPEIRPMRTSWGALKDTLTFKGINMYSRKYERQSTYGGKLVENIDQAVSRDLMAEAMLRMEDSGVYIPVLSVHDEAIAEAPLGSGDVRAFEAMMAQTPAWAAGCPVEAEGWSGTRYRK